MRKLKAYMAFSRMGGPESGAFLVFAHTAKEAKKISWPAALLICEDFGFLDLGIRLIKDAPWLFGEMEKDEPHVIECPKSCNECEKWGHSRINEDGICEMCRNGEEN